MAKSGHKIPYNTGCGGCMSGFGNLFPVTRASRKRYVQLYYGAPEYVETVVATTSAGKVRGSRPAKDSPLQFLGVPYASVTARFEKPTSLNPWSDERDCLKPGPACPQGKLGMRFFTESFIPLIAESICEPFKPNHSYAYGMMNDTECLNLNVWTKSLKGSKPVMVWIHGGGFAVGSSIEGGMYDGARLAGKEDIVVVTINYRHNAFGFVHFPQEGITNIGIRDQIAALEWVRDNVHNFGGDPGNVTVMGESAGGMSVGTLLGAPRARGLFKRAIPMSGATLNTFDAGYYKQLHNEAEKAWSKDLGGKPLTSSALKSLPSEKLARMAGNFLLRPPAMKLGSGGMAFSPLRGDDIVPSEGPHSGIDRSVDVFVGYMANEFKLFRGMLKPETKDRSKAITSIVPDLRSYFQRTTNDDAPGDEQKWITFAEKFYSLFEKHAEPRGDQTKVLCCLESLRSYFLFAYPALCLARDSSGYAYVCHGWDGDGSHGDDIALLFQHPYEWIKGSRDAKTLPSEDVYNSARDNFTKACVNFMRTGVPYTRTKGMQSLQILHMHATKSSITAADDDEIFVAFQALEKEVMQEFGIRAAMPHVRDAAVNSKRGGA